MRVRQPVAACGDRGLPRPQHMASATRPRKRTSRRSSAESSDTRCLKGNRPITGISIDHDRGLPRPQRMASATRPRKRTSRRSSRENSDTRCLKGNRPITGVSIDHDRGPKRDRPVIHGSRVDLVMQLTDGLAPVVHRSSMPSIASAGGHCEGVVRGRPGSGGSHRLITSCLFVACCC